MMISNQEISYQTNNYYQMYYYLINIHTQYKEPDQQEKRNETHLNRSASGHEMRTPSFKDGKQVNCVDP